MMTFGLDYLTNFFQDDSIRELHSVYVRLHLGSCNQAEKISLQERFLSVIEAERKRDKAPVHTAPSGMAFLYCDFKSGRYLLLNLNGVMEVLQDWLIYDGELDVRNVHWIEEDHLVTFDAIYIVRQNVQKYVCHYSNDSNAFVYCSEISKRIPDTIWADDRILDGETVWICAKCAKPNLMIHRCCAKCGNPRNW